MADQPPALVICAHGTDDADGRQTTLDIANAVARRLPDTDVTTAYVDVQEPSLDDEIDRLTALGHAVVIVPVLLTTGFHLEVDVARAVTNHPGTVVSAGALGPHDFLLDALQDRLSDAPADASVVVAIAGSRRPAAHQSALELVDAFAQRLSQPVTLGFLAASQPRLADAVTSARAAHPDRPVAIASYLTGRGFFHRLAHDAGADFVSEPLADHPRLIDLVVANYESLAAEVA